MTEFISTAEASAEFQVAHTQLENWRSRDYGPPYFKIGGAVMYDRTELMTWFKARRVEPSSPTPSGSLKDKRAAQAASRRKVSRSRKADEHVTA